MNGKKLKRRDELRKALKENKKDVKHILQMMRKRQTVMKKKTAIVKKLKIQKKVSVQRFTFF